MKDIDAFLRKLYHGEKVSRHDHEIPGHTIRELESKGYLALDDDGHLVAGPLLELFFEAGDSHERSDSA